MCDLLGASDERTVCVLLDGLNNILSAARKQGEVDKFETYEDYLDSLVSEEDHRYLEDEEMARTIAELGYRYSLKTMVYTQFTQIKTK